MMALKMVHTVSKSLCWYSYEEHSARHGEFLIKTKFGNSRKLAAVYCAK